MHVDNGLRRGEAYLVDHRENWAIAFEKECGDLKLTLSEIALEIEHVGSTAVAGLKAKPIIDIAVAVQSTKLLSEIIPKMDRLGYMFRGDYGANGGCLFVKESAPHIRTHHLHLVEATDSQWFDYLRFRDRLRCAYDLRENYGKLKSDLSKQYPDDRCSYTAAKDEFIKHVLHNAR